MNYYRLPERKGVQAGFLLFLLAIQMLARSSMVVSTFMDFMVSQYIVMGLVLAAAVVFLICNRRHLKEILTDRRMAAVVFFTVAVLGNMLIKQDWKLIYFSILFYICFAVFLNYLMPLKDAAKYYVVLMFLLSVYALIGLFVLKPLYNFGLIPGFEFDSPGGWHMLNYGLTFTIDRNNQNVNALRNFGVFREPGLYQIFLFVAIQLNNYTVEWKKQWQMWAVDAVLFVALLTTFATGGVLALGLYIVFLFFDKKLYKNKKLRILAVVCVLLGIGGFTFLLIRGGTWAYELVGMMEKIFRKTDSYTDRVAAIIADTRIFLQNPIVGEKMDTVMYSVPNNTASSPILFAAFGIVMATVHVGSWVALAWRKDRHFLMNVILLVILFVPFNTQNVIHDMFFWLFPIMALLEKVLPQLDKIKKLKKV